MFNQIKTISQSENQIDTNQLTAIIYSIDELGYYQVEIRQHKDSHFLLDKNGEIQTFRSLAEAKKSAVSQGVVKGYQAISTTYHELDLSSDTLGNFQHRYDYLLIDLAEIN